MPVDEQVLPMVAPSVNRSTEQLAALRGTGGSYLTGSSAISTRSEGGIVTKGRPLNPFPAIQLR